MNILILGVNGFIGHHLSKRILGETDWHVFGMDMNQERITDLLEDARFHFFEGDITINKEWVEYHVKKCDVVLPLVAIATPATYVKDPLAVFELDFEANLPIVRACVRHGKRILFPSTSEVYGMCADAQFHPADSNLVLGPIFENLGNVINVIRRNPDSSRPAEYVAVLLARPSDGRRVHDGHHLGKILDQDAVV